MISAEEAEMLSFSIENGYAIIPRAVDEATIKKAKASNAEVYQQGRAFVETHEYGGVRDVRVEPRHRGMQHKLIDAYSHSADIREQILSARMVRFLSIIFDRPALAFQGLYFENGSQQDIHQDTAYVRVNHLIEIVGTWIAMEDVQQGSGGLEYYVGTRRVPEFLFGGTSKWMPYDSTEHLQFLAHLKTEPERMGLNKERFRPKKGDALIWNANLCHGGAPITNNTSRQSFDTHWCPLTSNPFYFGNANQGDKIKVSDRAYYSFSFHGPQTDP